MKSDMKPTFDWTWSHSQLGRMIANKRLASRSISSLFNERSRNGTVNPGAVILKVTLKTEGSQWMYVIKLDSGGMAFVILTVTFFMT